jgi:hypothetical protein
MGGTEKFMWLCEMVLHSKTAKHHCLGISTPSLNSSGVRGYLHVRYQMLHNSHVQTDYIQSDTEIKVLDISKGVKTVSSF